MPSEPNEWTSASIALVQYGGIRNTLDKGGKLVNILNIIDHRIHDIKFALNFL